MLGILRTLFTKMKTNHKTLPAFKVPIESVRRFGGVNIITVAQNATHNIV